MDVKQKTARLSVVPKHDAEESAPAANSNQSIAGYMQDLIDRLNGPLTAGYIGADDETPGGEPPTTIPFAPPQESPVKPADSTEDRPRAGTRFGGRVYDLEAVRTEADHPREARAKVVKSRTRTAFFRLAISLIAIAGAMMLFQWGTVRNADSLVLCGEVLLVIAIFWLWRYFGLVRQVNKSLGRRKGEAVHPVTPAQP